MGRILRSADLNMGQPYVDPTTKRQAEAQRIVNCERGLPSVLKGGPGGRAAIVGYGPSLADTWEKVFYGEFDAVWTVSKAHDFLISRNALPTHHTDTDFREHKAKFNVLLRPTVRYMIATQVHPTYVDALKGYDVSLFHVEQTFGGVFPPGYLRQPAMFDAGLQASYLAFTLGFRDQEWFGMDASLRDGKAHAGPHEGLVPELLDMIVAGEPRVMSTLLIRQALWTEKMLCKLPHLKVKIHGDGALRPLLQERRKCTVS